MNKLPSDSSWSVRWQFLYIKPTYSMHYWNYCLLNNISMETSYYTSPEQLGMTVFLHGRDIMLFTHRWAFHVQYFSHAVGTRVSLSHRSTHQSITSLKLTSALAAHSSEHGASDSGLLLAEYKRCHAASLYLQMFLNPLDWNGNGSICGFDAAVDFCLFDTPTFFFSSEPLFDFCAALSFLISILFFDGVKHSQWNEPSIVVLGTLWYLHTKRIVLRVTYNSHISGSASVK